MRRPLIIALVAGLCGCPADGPLESIPDMSSQSDTGSETDMAQDGVVLLDVEPDEGPSGGGTIVTLTGTGFVAGMTVRFGSSANVDADVSSATEATATTPVSPVTGAVTVVVRTPDGATDSVQGAFTYTGEVQPSGGINFCQLQAQSPATTTTGVSSDVLYALVFADGITNGAGQGSGVDAELGWGSGVAYEGFNFAPMSYNLDADGLTPGDAANDEYGAPLTITTSGSYRYAARFRITGTAEWTYCDLDGNENGIADDQLGVIEVIDPATPTVGFCRTETQLSRAMTGSASEPIFGTVFVAGATPGAGAGAGVMGEVVYGTGADPASWTSVAASFASDGDGLTPGDLANDIWSAQITPPAEGAYQFAFRFSADGGTSWQLCDTDGSTGPADFDAGAVGTLEVSDVLVALADACNLQFPHILENAEIGTPIDIFGRVSEPGLTGSGTANANVVAEAFVGPTNTDPRTDFGAFETITASISTNTVNLAAGEDEYVASYTPTVAGAFAFGYRFSVDGGTSWAYCALQDDVTPTGIFTPSRLGSLTAAAGADTIDFCHVWQDTLTDDAGTTNLPTLTVEVFEDPVTVGNAGANSGMLEVQAAAMPREINPAFSTAAWAAIAYKDLRVGFPNNYEYEGKVYGAGNHPSAGTYAVVARVRRTGDVTWTYCDTDENAPEFRIDAATTLTVTP